MAPPIMVRTARDERSLDRRFVELAASCQPNDRSQFRRMAWKRVVYIIPSNFFQTRRPREIAIEQFQIRPQQQRSLPRDLENSRNSAVITTQTVWLPTSCGPVLQQPSRKKPVIGLSEQISIGSPSTLRAGDGLLPPSLRSSRSTRLPHVWGLEGAKNSGRQFVPRG